MAPDDPIDVDVLLRLMRYGAIGPSSVGLLVAAASGAWDVTAVSALALLVMVAIERFVTTYPEHAVDALVGGSLVLIVCLLPIYGGLNGPLLAALASPVMLAGTARDRRVGRWALGVAIVAVLAAAFVEAIGLPARQEQNVLITTSIHLSIVITIATYTSHAFRKVRCAITLAHDQEQRARQALRARNDELGRREIAEARMREAVEQAEASSTAKSEFLANMSHELRTPLNAIIGYAEMLIEEEDDPLASADLARIRRSGTHLLSLINDVLDLSKIEAGRMDLAPESLELETLLDDVEQAVMPLMLARDNRFEVHDEAQLTHFSADPMRTRQVLLNLLSNAAKFTERGRVSLRVRTVTDQGRHLLQFVVEDTGVGIDEQVMSRLFRPFVQGHAGAHHQGTGLGLVLSRSFAQMMDGDVHARSVPGVGSVFTFELPVQAPAMAIDALSERRRREALVTTRPVAVCVDDEPRDIEVLDRRLSQEGFLVVPCRDARDAHALAAALHPALMTINLHMPHIDGRTLLGRLRGDPELDDIALALVCTDGPVTLPDLDRVGTLLKPIRRKQLVGVLRQLLPEMHSEEGRVRAEPLAS